MDTIEKKLIEECKKNKKEAFGILYKRYQNYIYRICFRYTNSKEESLDIVQEIFIKIYKSIEGFDVKKPFLPWIRKISVNTCITYFRKRRECVSLDLEIDDDKNTLMDVTPSDENVENEVVNLDTGQIIRRFMAALPEDIRMAMVLRHMENLSYDEISDAMGIPLGTVKTYIYRGRVQLKDRLKKVGVWEE